MKNCKIGCIICKKDLKNFQEADGNQPMNGIEFTTQGHYGSTVFDPMDGSFMIINICDNCIQKAINDNMVIIK